MERETQWIINQYPALANHPLSDSRSKEFDMLSKVAEHYGLVLTMEDFDIAIAERFGYGCEYEWPRD